MHHNRAHLPTCCKFRNLNLFCVKKINNTWTVSIISPQKSHVHMYIYKCNIIEKAFHFEQDFLQTKSKLYLLSCRIALVSHIFTQKTPTFVVRCSNQINPWPSREFIFSLKDLKNRSLLIVDGRLLDNKTSMKTRSESDKNASHKQDVVC